ncbi:prepilin-type N-terminal cleavage/methylation domain-containing protein [Methylicorpusculum sp.]|uniref:prepilin-type N-terminal cleavage/methylation domain-containing protein n=1 Tax=Methylicorpusculum sp. TaxID=2713644 RepID=UPI002725481D|nr:prepilin-type N-terminal cleavage/methylation domain-containing protein [Methylicorpusculum sp.]MDO8845399.1 prepilin-type N-terminal cleavage/methylation domain-containing protein [Methylicorpusculum sp.]
MFCACRQKGFTLIEIMMAMTLLSLMMVLLFGALRISAQSWEVGEGKVAQVSETAMVYQFFRRHLAIAQPLWHDFSEDEERAFSFRGTAESVQFVSPLPASAARPGLQVFTVYLQQENGNNALKVSIKPFFPSSDEQAWQDEDVVILTHVSLFQMSYFESDPLSESGGWQQEWVDRETLPSLIKIRIARDNELYWPDMVIPVKLSAAESYAEFSADSEGDIR